MNDLYCKDFEFLNKENQIAYDNLKQTILKRSRLDLEFLQSFMQFSSNAFCSTQFICVRSSGVYAKDDTRIGAIDFCAVYLGLSESTVKKLYLTYERFIIDKFDVELSNEKTFSWLVPEFNDMSLTKIFELLSISYNQLNKDFEKGTISPNMTVKQLRDYVKAFKDGNALAKKILEKRADKDEELEEQSTNYSKFRKTYDKIISYIDFFKSTEETDPVQLKKLFVTDLHSIKNALIKEFGLEIVK